MIRVPIPTRLSTRITQLRHQAGFTQKQLAQRSGIGHGSIGQYETGRSEPRILNLLRIIKACGSTPVEFFDREIRLWEPTTAGADRTALRMAGIGADA